jgi:hypothetical protein
MSSKCIGVCDVTSYVTPTMSSQKCARYMCLILHKIYLNVGHRLAYTSTVKASVDAATTLIHLF